MEFGSRHLMTTAMVGLGVALGSGTDSAAAVHVARPEGPTIGAMVARAAHGDTVSLQPGTYRGESNRDVRITGKALVVRGDGPPESVVVDCEGLGRAFAIEGDRGGQTTLENFTVRGGRSTQGGGLRIQGAQVRLEDLHILDNTATTSGGGVHAVGSMVGLYQCRVENNRAASGGGVFCDASVPSIFDTALIGNLAVYGGGIYSTGSDGEMEASRLDGNLAWAGGAMCLSESAPEIRRCWITANDAQTGGGGIRCVQLSSPEISNSFFVGNRSRWNGGGLHCRSRSSPQLVHCTFAGNVATNDGSAIFSVSGSCEPLLQNSILHGKPPQVVSGRGRIRMESSAWAQPGGPLPKLDTRFVDLLDGNYRLPPGSPAIDAAVVHGVADVDWEGEGRPWGSAPDLGADEWVPGGLEP